MNPGRRFRALALVASVVITVPLGVWLGLPWLLPLLCAAVPYAFFAVDTRRNLLRSAVTWVLLWAVLQSVAIVAATCLAPEQTANAVLRGPEYASEMLHWARTGEGAESSPQEFLPLHARHFALFAVLSMATVGAGALVLGAALLNYMNVYVAELILASEAPWIAMVFGWPPWAILRVIGFVVTGAALTAWSWQLWRRRRVGPPRRALALGLVLVVADAVLKALLAPGWQKLLARGLEGP